MEVFGGESYEDYEEDQCLKQGSGSNEKLRNICNV